MVESRGSHILAIHLSTFLYPNSLFVGALSLWSHMTLFWFEGCNKYILYWVPRHYLKTTTQCYDYLLYISILANKGLNWYDWTTLTINIFTWWKLTWMIERCSKVELQIVSATKYNISCSCSSNHSSLYIY